MPFAKKDHLVLPASAASSSEPQGNGADIGALQRHQQRLLYGAGIMLTTIILVILLIVLAMRVSDYKSAQLEEFANAKLTVDSWFIQRDIRYIRTKNLIEYAWRDKAAKLIADGDMKRRDFTLNNNTLSMKASPSAAPLLVLGTDLSNWPQEKLDRYLGMVAELSVIRSTSPTWRHTRSRNLSYFYDPSKKFFAFDFFAFDGVADEKQLQHAENVLDRAQLFEKLAIPEIDFADEPAPQPVNEGSNALPYGTLPYFSYRIPGVRNTFGRNPVTGEPAIIGSYALTDDGTPFGGIAFYESAAPFGTELAKVTRSDFAVLSKDGQVVFGSGTAEQNEASAAAYRPFMTSKGASESLAISQRGMHYFISQRVGGSDWALVRNFTWLDMLRDDSRAIAYLIGLTLLLLGALWAMLVWLNHKIFVPTLARAKRVYQSEALNRTIVEATPVGLGVVAVNDAIPLLQNDLLQSYAADTHEAGENLYQQLLQGHDKATQELSGRAGGREFNITLPSINGGKARHLLIAAMLTPYQDRKALLCVLRDVTARTELEENLRQARRDSEQAKLAAESASQAKTSFVATMSHEIRTPLNGILGHLELLGRSHLDPSQQERLDRIRLSADNLLGIISDVLDFSRIEAGQLDIDPIEFLLRPLVEQTALLYAPSAQRKGLALYVSIDPSLPQGYIGDAHRIGQVLNNLVSNAVKFTESGRIAIRVTASNKDQTDDELLLRFEVVDSGIGMESEQLAQVFQPFSQADSSISRRFGGSGLGLALCKDISELMGGDIAAQSARGVGSAFAMTLPLTVDLSMPSGSEQVLTSMRLALLSASAEWRNEITGLLSAWGAEVVTASQPADIDLRWLRAADALIVFGTERSWDEEEERSVLMQVRRVIRAQPDGPLVPAFKEGALLVSSYSAVALESAILDDSMAIIDARAIAASEASSSSQRAYRGRVLLVDDNAVNRELIQQQLELLGFAVDTAEDGEAALGLWRDDRFVAVLTDINMPKMNGYVLAEHLREAGATLPILAVTATAMASEKVRCKESGIDDLLLKPLSLDQLQAATDAYLPEVTPASAVVAKKNWSARHSPQVHEIFVESGTQDLEVILDAWHNHNEAVLLSRLHGLKGALLMLGEKGVAAQCASIEQGIERNGLASSTQALHEFEGALRELLRRYATD